MVKHLYLMRHGETLFNKLKKIQGWCDSPLTENGIAQAKAAKKLVEHVQFDHFYSSTSERCCDTLELIIGHETPYTRLKGLKERNFGEFEGESEHLNPRQGMGIDYEDLFPHYGGEYGKDWIERVASSIIELMAKEDHQNVLAVSHGGSCFSFLSTVTDPSVVYSSGGFTNCCILHFEYEDGKFKFIEVLRPEL